MANIDPEREKQLQREAYARRLKKMRGYDKLRAAATMVVRDRNQNAIKALERTLEETQL